jgi:hypothetical protein
LRSGKASEIMDEVMDRTVEKHREISTTEKNNKQLQTRRRKGI